MNWKQIEGYEGRYLISDTGLVFSAESNKILSASKRRYSQIELNYHGKANRAYIHRLVAEAFLPNPNNYPCVNHKDENPRNNNVENLEWCTYEYNSNYGTIKERISKHNDYKSGFENARSIPVFQFNKDGSLVGIYGSSYEAAQKLNLNAKSIAKARSGVLKEYAGFVWNSKNEFSYNPKRTHFKAGPVLQFDLSGKFIKRYEAPKYTSDDGFDPNAVRDVCRGKLKSHKGYVFKYEEVRDD